MADAHRMFLAGEWTGSESGATFDATSQEIRQRIGVPVDNGPSLLLEGNGEAEAAGTHRTDGHPPIRTGREGAASGMK